MPDRLLDATPSQVLAPRRADPECADATAEAVVDVVVVGYHSRELIRGCLDALTAAADGVPVTVTVVDNGSADGTVSAVRAWAAAHPGVRTEALDLGANTGFAHACNAGMAAGRAPYLLVLNPDTVPEPACVRRLVEFASSTPGLGVVAPQLVNPDGSAQLTGRSFPTAAAGLFGRRSPLTRWFPDNRWSTRFLVERQHLGDVLPYRVDWVSGAAMIVPRGVLEQVGGFDEGFFLFWEDADWCRRIVEAGYSVWCLPTARIVHDEGGTRQHAYSPAAIRSFHAGAYRYWTKHQAPQWWNPLRWSAAAALTARAGLLLLRHAVRRAALVRSFHRPTGTAKGSPS